MSARTASFVACRTLAILFLLTACSYVINTIVFMATNPEGRNLWRALLPPFTNGLVHFLFAGFLWRNADNFGVSSREKKTGDSTAGEPMAANAILRISIAIISIYAVSTHLPIVLNFLFDLVRGSGAERAYPGRYTVGELATFVLAIIAVPISLRGMSLARVISYPRLEADEDPKK
jgi:hypothetical protein